MTQAEYHQWELEQQERDMEEQDKYESEKNRLLGLMFAQVDCINAYEQNKFLREMAIYRLCALKEEYEELQNKFWGRK
jgi:hypothetical protein